MTLKFTHRKTPALKLVGKEFGVVDHRRSNESPYLAQMDEALALMPMAYLENAGVTRRELRLLFTGALLALRVPFEDALQRLRPDRDPANHIHLAA